MRLPPGIQADRARLFKFLLVGAVNTAFGYSVFLIALWSGMHYALAAGLATVLGIFFNFIATGCIVFGGRELRRLPRFVMVYALVYAVNILGLKIFLFFGVHAWVGGLFLILPCAVLSYILNRNYVFRQA
ncbi:GtrA family protein [Acidovorax sp. SDU_ACID1]|uniref:GtrA family protein n=1 Tax=Acidovorax sp. SDU_ACID1 TaxID=3136632 RepID=UPI00387306E9